MNLRLLERISNYHGIRILDMPVRVDNTEENGTKDRRICGVSPMSQSDNRPRLILT